MWAEDVESQVKTNLWLAPLLILLTYLSLNTEKAWKPILQAAYTTYSLLQLFTLLCTDNKRCTVKKMDSQKKKFISWGCPLNKILKRQARLAFSSENTRNARVNIDIFCVFMLSYITCNVNVFLHSVFLFRYQRFLCVGLKSKHFIQ